MIRFRPLEAPTPFLFFTGKGGVGKTSLACATAIGLADRGRRVLLVSTDPASNLDEMLGVALGHTRPTCRACPRLSAMNIDPEAAAESYRARVLDQLAPADARGGARHRARAALRRLHDGDRRLRRVRRAARRRRDRRSTTSSSTRPRPATRCGCSACRRPGPASWKATTAAPPAWARIPA